MPRVPRTPAPPSQRASRRYSLVVALAGVALVAAGGLRVAMPVAAVAPGNAAFQEVWSRPDGPVADGLVSRTWIWGPEANTPIIEERYADSPGGLREVQYFDKARMEITHPDGDSNSIWYVTNGLLVVELVSGRMQTGDNRFEQREPAEVNVAGDADDPDGVTYATMAGVRNDPPLPDGAPIIWRLARDGTITVDPDLAAYAVVVAYHVVVDGIDHQVAAPFWEFMNAAGTVYDENGQPVDAALFPDPFYATGFPIGEAFWVRVLVAGVEQDVLVQCFQRRCLTFTPGNATGWKIEAGNVGLHYRIWRLGDDPDPDPTATEPGGEPTTPTTPTEPTETNEPGSPTWTTTATETGTIVVIQCDVAYPDFCIPPPPPDLDCDDFSRQNFTALPPDPHNLDPDHDGVACEPPPANTPTSTSIASPTATGEASPTATEGEDENEAACLNALEEEFLGLINAYRASLGLSTLHVSRALNIASHKHSADMGERHYFDHFTAPPLPPGQSGPSPWDRMTDEGYDYNTYKAENIARGYPTAQQVFTAWRNSEGHDQNMRNPNLKAIGIGQIYAEDDTYGYYWTTDFGGVIDAAPGC